MLNRLLRRTPKSAIPTPPLPKPRNDLAAGDGTSTTPPCPVSDPYPSIPPALLNSADIQDYATALQMISPFDDSRLKPASYAIGLGTSYATARQQSEGSSVWEWSHQSIDNDDAVVRLPPNSLIYVSLDTQLRLPPFIAARFNLNISHVYRGLLAGTGPLVDPGFHGDLFIPLHNLSSNEYSLKPKENLIWMEFTKISPNDLWSDLTAVERQRSTLAVPLAQRKSGRGLGDYLHEASDTPIRSSIDYAIVSAERNALKAKLAADQAAAEARRVRWQLTIGGLIAVVAVLVATATMFFQVLALVNDVAATRDNGELEEAPATETSPVPQERPGPSTAPSSIPTAAPSSEG